VVRAGVESLFPVRKRGFISRGINGFLSVKNLCLVLRQTGINAESMAGLRGILEHIFTIYAVLLPYT
jgi:hypothetical protein